MWYIISVGGCGGMLYMMHLKYIKDLLGDRLWWRSYGKEEDKFEYYYDRRLGEAMDTLKPLFRGIKIDAEEGEEFFDKEIKCYHSRGGENGQMPYYCHYIIYNKVPISLGNKVKEKLDIDLIEDPGFQHHPERQMICLAVKEVREYIMGNIDKELENDGGKAAAGIFFLVGFGGGTGTGIIEVIVKEIFGAGRPPAFALTVLSGKNDVKIQDPYCRRCFNLICALNNLLACGVLDGVILVDNNTLNKKFGNKEVTKIDQHIVSSIFSLFKVKSPTPESPSLYLRRTLKDDLKEKYGSEFTPIFIPCYCRGKGKIEELLKEAINNGKLAKCDNPKSADGMYIFIRNSEGRTIKKERLKEELRRKFEVQEVEIITVDPIVGINENEILVFLRNPDVSDILSDRIENAKAFAELIQKIDEKLGGDLDIKNDDIKNDPEIKNLIQKLKESGGEEDKKILERMNEGKPYEQIIFDSAKDFLFPRGGKHPYPYMKKFIYKFVEEVKKIQVRKLPIFNSMIEFEEIKLEQPQGQNLQPEDLKGIFLKMLNDDIFVKKIKDKIERVKNEG